MCALYGITTFLNLNKVQDFRLDEHLYVDLNYLVQDFRQDLYIDLVLNSEFY